MSNIKRNLKMTILALILAMGILPVYADDVDTPSTPSAESQRMQTDGVYNVEEDKKKTEDMLSRMFEHDLSDGRGIDAGVNMSKPFVYIIQVLSIFIVIVVAYLFVGVTTLDLAYIIVPPIRGLLMKRKESSGTQQGGSGFMCISDSCLAAVDGTGGPQDGLGGMGRGNSSGDRGVGSCLVRYVTSRTKEFMVFILFVMLFLTGMLGRITIVIFRMFSGLFQGLANFF